MAVRYAVASGVWSSGSIWDNGSVPLTGDDVYTNNQLVTLDQNISVLRIASSQSPVVLPNMSIPAMTSNTLPAGTGIAYANAGNAFSAFDQILTTFWQSSTANVGFVGYQFNSGKILKRYAFYTYNPNQFNPRNWTFEGSNDGTSYTVIETVSAFTTTVNTWYVRDISANTTSYTYYRMNITAVQTVGNAPVIPELQMTESTGSVYGTGNSGSFISTNGISITASNPLYGISAGSFSSALLITGSHTVYVSGSIRGGTSNNIRGVQIVNNGNLYVTGSVTGGTVATLGYGVFNNAGRLEILGNIFGGVDTTCHAVAVANGTTIINGNLYGSLNAAPIVMIAGSGSLSINGDTINTTGTNIGQATGVFINGSVGTLNFNGILRAYNAPGILCNTAATINVTGPVYAERNNGIQSTGASILRVIGPIYSSNAAPGISSTQTTATVTGSGPLISENGYNAVYSPKIQLMSGSNPLYIIQRDAINQDITLYDTSYTSSLPLQFNVRSGSIYGGLNEFSGSMVVPLPTNVRYGVPIDNTTGSATLSPQDIFDFAVQNLTGSNTIGERLKNISTVQTVAATIAAYNGK